MDLSTIRGYVKDYMVDVPSTVTNALIDAWVNEGLRKAETRHNFRYMEAQDDFTTTVSTRKLSDKPDRWKEFRGWPWYLREDGSDRQVLWAPSASDMRTQFDDADTDDDGAPQFVLETTDELHVYPYPNGDSDYSDGEYRLKVPYWKRSADLSEDSDGEVVNPLIGLAPWYPIWYAVHEGLLLTRDEQRAGIYLNKAEQEFKLAVGRDKRSRLPDRMTLVPRTGVYGNSLNPRNRRGRRF